MNSFGEKDQEYSRKQGRKVDVWQSPKYEQSKAKALEILEKYSDVKAGDFWILMNETKSGKMAYTGLIVSHNACLKINEHLAEADKFRPDCVSLDKEGYKGELVYTYCSSEQGLYEVGEVSASNCRNEYPYAMAFKRLFDRVVLKQSKLAFDGIYSDSEADEFKEDVSRKEPKNEVARKEPKNDESFEDIQITKNEEKAITQFAKEVGSNIDDICKAYGVISIGAMSKSQYANCFKLLKKKSEKATSEQDYVI